MRDDRIVVMGPFKIPDMWVPEYTDEDDGVIPAHLLRTPYMRRFEFEFRDKCSCGRIHGYTIDIDWDLHTSYPELFKHTMDTVMRQLLNSVESCDGGAP